MNASTVWHWINSGSVPTGKRGDQILESIHQLTGIEHTELGEIIRRSRAAAASSATVDSLPVIVQELITVALRLPRRQQQELLTFAQFRAEQAQ